MEASAASNITTPTVANSKCKYVDYVFLASNPNPNITTATATVANSKCTKLDYKQQSLVLQQMIAANELEQDRLRAQKDELLQVRVKQVTIDMWVEWKRKFIQFKLETF